MQGGTRRRHITAHRIHRILFQKQKKRLINMREMPADFIFYLHLVFVGTAAVPRFFRIPLSLSVCRHIRTFFFIWLSQAHSRSLRLFPVSMHFFFWLLAPVTLFLDHHMDIKTQCVLRIPALDSGTCTQSFYLYLSHSRPPPPDCTHPPNSLFLPSFSLSLAPAQNALCPALR